MGNKYIKQVANSLNITNAQSGLYFNEILRQISPTPTFEIIANEILKNKQYIHPHKVAEQITYNHQDYRFSKIGIQDFLHEVNKYIFPRASNKEIQRYIKDWKSYKSPEQIANILLKSSNKFIPIGLNRLYISVKLLIFPEINIELFNDAQQNPNITEDPILISNRVIEKHDEFILSRHKTLYDKVNKLVYPSLSVSDFKTKHDEQHDERDPIFFVNIFIEDNKYILRSVCEQIREYIFPTISYKAIHQYLINNPSEKIPIEISKNITFGLHDYIHKSEIDLFNLIQGKTHPELLLKDFSVLLSKNPGIFDPDALAKSASDSNDKYMIKEEWNLYQNVHILLYPKFTEKDFNEFRKVNTSSKSAEEMADIITQESNSYILISTCEQTQNLLHPSPDVQLIYKTYKNNKGTNSPELLSNVILQSFPKKYIPRSYRKICENIQGGIYPPPDLTSIYLVIRHLDISNIKELIIYFINESAGGYIPIEDKNICIKARDCLHPQPSIQVIYEIKRNSGVNSINELIEMIIKTYPNKYIISDEKSIYARAKVLLYPQPELLTIYQIAQNNNLDDPKTIANYIKNNSKNQYLLDDVVFELGVLTYFFQGPDIRLIIQERKKYSPLLNENEIANKIAKSHPNFILMKDKLQSDMWYGD